MILSILKSSSYSSNTILMNVILVNNTPINRDVDMKLLELTLDQRLRFSAHFDNIVIRACFYVLITLKTANVDKNGLFIF